MRITLFGDVHGNLIALEKLFQIERSQTDLFICHGDIVNYGPWSNESVEFLKTINNCKLLKGNHEDYFLNGSYDGTHEVAKSFFEFCYKRFNSDLIHEISKYENQMIILNFTIQHTIEDKYIFEDTNIDDLKIDSNYIIGHSHQQYKVTKDNFKIYNTGSIGQNRSLLNVSSYLKIDTEKKTVELKNFIHNIDKVIKQMEIEKYPQICLDYYRGKKRA